MKKEKEGGTSCYERQQVTTRHYIEEQADTSQKKHIIMPHNECGN